MRARRGYVDYSQAVRRVRAVNAALALPGTVLGLPVAAQALRGWASEEGQSVMLAVAVPPGTVGMRLDPEGRPSAELEFHVLVVEGKAYGGAVLTAYVEVYGGMTPSLAGTLFTAAQGAAGEPIAEMSALPMSPAAAGLHRGALPLPTGLPPGSYVLRLVVTDPAAEKSRLLGVSLDILIREGRESGAATAVVAEREWSGPAHRISSIRRGGSCYRPSRSPTP